MRGRIKKHKIRKEGKERWKIKKKTDGGENNEEGIFRRQEERQNSVRKKKIEIENDKQRRERTHPAVTKVRKLENTK